MPAERDVQLSPSLVLAAKNIPTELITGFVVLHAERVIQSSLEAFVVRLYRQANLVRWLTVVTLIRVSDTAFDTERIFERLL
jgi:hypothetical protein